MIRRFLPLILVLAPAGLGGLARLLAILDGNATFTATAGIVAPQEVAHTLSARTKPSRTASRSASSPPWSGS